VRAPDICFCSRRDRGQATPLLMVVIALTAVAAVALAELGGAAVAATRAQTAADAAALAGAAEGEAAARSVAAANGAELVAHRRDGAVVRVEVRLGGARATARAEAVGGGAGWGEPAGGGDRAGLAPAMVAALARADTLLGRPVPVVSGLRTRVEQEALWANRHRNPYPVARPGTSAHERGMAVDVPREVVAALLAVAPSAGLCQPLPRTDPVHFVTCPPTDPA
jgi:hypothetical protein